MKNNHIKHDLTWVDYLRVIACILVVLAHCCDPYVCGETVESFTAGSFYGTFCRPSVPLFMMISGLLLLPSSLRMGDFYAKRFKRLLTPFIFWSLVTPFLFYVLVSCITILNPSITLENHTLNATLNDMWLWLFSFNYATVPYWYIYMMLGVYLIIPIVSDWIKQASKKELQTILFLWCFSTIIPYLRIVLPSLGYLGNYDHDGLYGECSWNLYSTFYYVSGFIGYVLLGYYFHKYPLTWSLGKTWGIAITSWALGFAITYLGFHYIHDNFPDNFNMLEIPWAYNSINVVMMTLPYFILTQKIATHPCAFITRLADYSYGIFLLHFVIVQLCYEIVARYIIVTPLVQLPIVLVLAFSLTACIIALLRRIPIFRQLS